MYSNQIIQQVYSLPFPLNDETNLIFGKSFHPGQKICIITPFGLQFDRFSYTSLCSRQPDYSRLKVSLMRFPGVPTFRCTMSITVARLSKGCAASVACTGIVDCSSSRGLQAFILCLCCQRHCDKSIYDLRILTKYLQTRFGTL